MIMKVIRHAIAAVRRWLHRATEPHILFPAITIIVLAVIWGTTLNLIRSERATAEHNAASSSHLLTETYEALVVRALREIDQTLKIVQTASEVWNMQYILPNLRSRELLPPALVFTVSITDSKGNIVVSNGASKLSNVADQDYFQSQLQTDTFSISLSQPDPDLGESRLHFSHRLEDTDGQFSGIVMISVDAAYFVSSYNLSVMGQHGLLGILDSNGIIIVRRSGETVSAGDRTDYSEITVHEVVDEGTETTLAVDSLDGVLRYLEVHQLYDFPLQVIIGLSQDEQLAATRSDMHTYLWRAAAASGLLILIAAMLGYMSSQLIVNRRKIVEVQLAQAERNQYLAFHDMLTELPNRSLFSKLLVQGIQLANRYKRQLSVLFLDLDRFKHINDTLGHEAGDQLLQEVALRLKSCLRDSDTVARLGGDEFVVLLPELYEDKYVSIVATKILTAIAKPFILMGQEFRITASVGISIYPQDGLDEQTLTKNADNAMYHAKDEGRNNFKFYSVKMNTDSLERLSLESRLRHALEHNEFQLHYQVKRDTHNGQITGMEALLRWQHPDLGTVAPLQFLPLAEETGLILPIGKWVFKTACMQNLAWQKQGLPPMTISVNLTLRQFEDETLLPDLKTILADTGMDPRLLELEISEVLLMRDIDKNLKVLTGLKEIGVRVAIDDFGSGYASLAALKQFPLDTIKIDRSIIANISKVSEDKALIDAIFALGRTLSLTIVAQGVETKEQADFLSLQSAGEFQGFYLNKPMSSDETTKLLQLQAKVAKGDTPVVV